PTNGRVAILDAGFNHQKHLPKSGARMAASPDGKLLATGTWLESIKLWNCADWQPAGELSPVRGIASIDFSPDGKLLITGADDGELSLWDIPNRKLRVRRQLQERS